MENQYISFNFRNNDVEVPENKRTTIFTHKKENANTYLVDANLTQKNPTESVKSRNSAQFFDDMTVERHEVRSHKKFKSPLIIERNDIRYHFIYLILQSYWSSHDVSFFHLTLFSFFAENFSLHLAG